MDAKDARTDRGSARVVKWTPEVASATATEGTKLRNDSKLTRRSLRTRNVYKQAVQVECLRL
jgi:hypothetical protein